jgi:hypothetical protein
MTADSQATTVRIVPFGTTNVTIVVPQTVRPRDLVTDEGSSIKVVTATAALGTVAFAPAPIR